MTIEPTTWKIGALVEYERLEAISEFAAELPGNYSMEECVASHIKQIDQVVTHKSGGRISINTHIMGNRKVDDVTRYNQYTTRSTFRS